MKSTRDFYNAAAPTRARKSFTSGDCRVCRVNGETVPVASTAAAVAVRRDLDRAELAASAGVYRQN
jgi:hypothetical protein